jgi:O-succinylbenzoic acid--CoA ligase
VVLSRAALRASATGTTARLGGPGQWLLNLPGAYVAGLQVLFRSILAGTEPVLQDEHPDFVEAAAAMTGERRYVSLVPTQLARMLGSAAEVEALRGFDTILIGGAGMDPALRRTAEDAGLRLVATYGMSETCGGCVYDGLPLDGVAVKVDAERRVQIAGPVLFERYDGAPDATSRVLSGGWFRTQDLGRLDEDGRLVVLGRIDDVVVSGGVNVPATAVAARLREHPGLTAAEVTGVADDEWGQRVVAVVVPADSAAAPTREELRDFVAAVHPRAWAPREVVVVDGIPLLGNGKIDRTALERIAAR